MCGAKNQTGEAAADKTKRLTSLQPLIALFPGPFAFY